MATMMLRARQPLVAASKGYMKKGLRFASSSTEFKNVLVEQRGRVGIITFNRPEVSKWCCTEQVRVRVVRN